MTSEPAILDLLAAARESLRQAVMPVLAGEQRYQAAMIASAIGLVERSLAEGGRGLEAGIVALAARYPEIDACDGVALRRRLSRDIRAGLYDGEAGSRLVAQVLKPAVRAKLAVSSPEHRWRP